MSRIAPVVPANTETKVASTLSQIKASLGNDGLMLEIAANIALHTLTNYANRLADTEIDSPVVEVSR
jgi:hypothetical protein